MPIVGGLDIHRTKQITFDSLDTGTGQVRRGQISPADREHLRAWLARFTGRDDVAFAVVGCTGWRYVAEEPNRWPEQTSAALRTARLAGFHVARDAVRQCSGGHRPPGAARPRGGPPDQGPGGTYPR